MLRITVAEDSVLFREGLTRLLHERGHRVIAAVGDADSLLEAVALDAPDIAIIDIRMPPTNSTDGAVISGLIRRRWPEVGTLLLSQHIALHGCLNLIGTPGFGYLLKDRVLHLDEFDDALHRIADGGTALDSEVVRALARGRESSGVLGTLTDRERTVLALVAEGHSNLAVARILTVSDRTVESHLRTIFTKLGLCDDDSSNRRVRAVIAYLHAAGFDTATFRLQDDGR